jgi:hypothetical protein
MEFWNPPFCGDVAKASLQGRFRSNNILADRRNYSMKGDETSEESRDAEEIKGIRQKDARIAATKIP